MRLSILRGRELNSQGSKKNNNHLSIQLIRVKKKRKYKEDTIRIQTKQQTQQPYYYFLQFTIRQLIKNGTIMR